MAMDFNAPVDELPTIATAAPQRNSYNPLSERDITRLRTAMESARRQKEPFVKQHLKMVRQYAGHGYGVGGASNKTPANVIKLAVDIYQRFLTARSPRALVNTKSSGLSPKAHELELAINHLIQEITLGKTFKSTVKTALFTMGVVKVGITPAPLGEIEGYQHDAGQPFADEVLFEDFLFAFNARRQEEWDWCGNMYRLPVDFVRSSELFDPQEREKVSSITEQSFRSQSSSQNTSAISQGSTAWQQDEYRDYVNLYDIWLPEENLIVTLPEGSGGPLRIVEWDGPERGPYHLLAFSRIPGNIIPVSPILQLQENADLLNRIYTQLGDQADRQKTILVVPPSAAADGSVERIRTSSDAAVITSNDPSQFKEIKFGGVDPGNVQYAMQLWEILNKLGGNLDSLGGLSQQGDTLGQERLLARSSSKMVADMQDTTTEWARNIVHDLAYYLYHDPFMELPLVKRINVGSMEMELPFSWGPERREADFFEYNFTVEPYSMQHKDPSEKLNLMMEVVGNFIMPALPMMQEQGLQFHFDKVLELFAKYGDFPEMGELVTRGGRPLGDQPPVSAGQPRQAAVTTRNTVRHNTGGSGGQNDSAQMLQALMRSGGNGDGGGGGNGFL